MGIYAPAALKNELDLSISLTGYNSLLEMTRKANTGIVLNEIEINVLNQKVEKFERDVEAYIEKCKESRDDKNNLANGYLLAGVGLYIVGLLTMTGAPALSILILIASIVSNILSISHRLEAAEEEKKLIKLKSNLIKAKEQVKSEKEKDKIRAMVDKIDRALSPS